MCPFDSSFKTTGYSDVKAFKEVYRKTTEMSPLYYQSGHNNDVCGLGGMYLGF
jgi:hypothetical protein